jgi:hypothetical protein
VNVGRSSLESSLNRWAAPGVLPGEPGRAAASASSAEITKLASGWGVSASAMQSFLKNGGELSVSSNPSALSKLPIGKDGAPDFDAITASGGTVKGAIPPLGLPKVTIVDDRGQTTFYAAEIDKGDGSAPTYVKGANVRAGSSNKQSDNFEMAATALQYFTKLPNSMAEALRMSGENFFDANGKISTYDARA